MKLAISAAVVCLVTAVSAHAQTPARDYPSCDIAGQRAVVSGTGGSIKDRNQGHISVRTNVLIADIGSARKARLLTQADADALFGRVSAVRDDANRLTGKQGFLSAAERASYDRELDAIAMRICGSGETRSYGNDALPSAEMAAFQRLDRRLRYRNARIEYDARGCALYEGKSKDGRTRRLPLTRGNGQRICVRR